MPPPRTSSAPPARKAGGGALARFDEALEHHRGGRLAEAEAIYRAILAVDPRHADALHLSGMVAYAQGRLQVAADLIEQAVALQPKADIYLGNLGNVRRALGDAEAAVAAYQRAIAANPDNPLPYGNLGNVLMDQNRMPEAIECYERALQRRPDFYETLFNYGLALRAANRVDDAVSAFRRAVTAEPERAEARYTLGQTLLLQGRFAEAWPEYDWRWRLEEYGWLRQIHGNFPQPRWRGEDIADKTILVYAEQGMGDSLHFVRYLAQLRQRARKVIFAVHPRLRRLFEQVPGIELTTLETVPWPSFDVHCPLLSLPQYFGTLSVADIPGEVPYLQAEPARVARWASWLAQKPGFRIGIAWQGNPNAKIDKGRSPPLAAFAPLARIPGVRLISLQRVDGLEQLSALPPGMAVEQLPADVDLDAAFVDTAAIMMGLDLLVLSDSAIVHLAGALARPVWVPLKQIPDWRFLLSGDTSPWYPTMRLFRQPSEGDWAPVFAAMAQELAHVVGAKNAEGEASTNSGLGFAQPRPGAGREAVLRETPGAVPPAPTSAAVAGQRDFSRLAAQLDAVAALPRWTLNPGLDAAIRQQMLERLRSEHVLTAGMTVLDVACGDGAALEWLQTQGIEARGLGVAHEVAQCAARGLTVALADDSLIGIDQAEASVDLIWARQCLQRSLAPYHTLSEYRRLLRGGGYVYVEVPAPDTVMQHQAVGTNFSTYGQSMWQELFQRAGFLQIWGVELGAPVGTGRDVVWAFLLRKS